MSTNKDELEDLLQTEHETAPDEPIDDPEEVEIPVDDEPEESAPKTRAERRKERGKLFKALMDSEKQKAALEARLARLEGVAQAVTSQAPRPEQQADPLELLHSEYISHRNRIQGEYEALAAAGNLTDDKRENLQRDLDSLELQRKKAEINIIRQQAGPQMDPQQVIKRAIQTQLAAKYPQVYANQRAVRYAGAVYEQIKLQNTDANGNPTIPPEEIHRMAMDQTMKDLGIDSGKRSAPTAPRHKFHGQGKGAAGGKSGPRTVRMTKENRLMADALYSHIPDEQERYKRWAKEVGSKLAQ